MSGKHFHNLQAQSYNEQSKPIQRNLFKQNVLENTVVLNLLETSVPDLE